MHQFIHVIMSYSYKFYMCQVPLASMMTRYNLSTSSGPEPLSVISEDCYCLICTGMILPSLFSWGALVVFNMTLYNLWVSGYHDHLSCSCSLGQLLINRVILHGFCQFTWSWGTVTIGSIDHVDRREQHCWLQLTLLPQCHTRYIVIWWKSW